MPDDTRTPAQRARDDNEREIFGPDPLRGPDGTPMERGSGSAFARMSDAEKAHFHAVNAHAAADEVMSMAKQLIAAVSRLGGALKETVETAQASKVAAQSDPVDPEAQTASEVAAKARAQEDAERDRAAAEADAAPRTQAESQQTARRAQSAPERRSGL